MRSLVFVATFLFFVFNSPSAYANPIRDRLRYGLNPFLAVTMAVPYGDDPEEIADIVSPTVGHTGGAVIMIHGGGWSAGDRLDMAGEAVRLAETGLTVININYRLGRVGQQHTHWPAQLQDAQLAVRWARTYSRILGFDRRRVCAYGSSAGGHLSMYLGYLRETMPGDRSQLYKSQSSAVDCVVNVGGPANLIHPAIAPILMKLPFLGTTDPVKAAQVLRAASPYFLISGRAAPTLIVQGKEDPIVPRVIAVETVAFLKQQNVPVVYRELDGGHVYEGTPAAQKKDAEHLIRKFLRSHLRRHKVH